MKYFSYDTGMNYVVYIFSNNIDHATFASALNLIRENITGAGFVTCDPANGPTCYGSSTSLKIACNEQIDTMLVRRQLGWKSHN